MEYRNIDNDAKLLMHVRRFYQNEINENQLKYILNDANYSETEIENAISDYKLININPIIYMNYIAFFLVVLLVVLPILYILTK